MRFDKTKRYCVKVKNETESHLFQTNLFKQGIHWCDDDPSVDDTYLIFSIEYCEFSNKFVLGGYRDIEELKDRCDDLEEVDIPYTDIFKTDWNKKFK